MLVGMRFASNIVALHKESMPLESLDSSHVAKLTGYRCSERRKEKRRILMKGWFQKRIKFRHRHMCQQGCI